jgi:hypothetical protein
VLPVIVVWWLRAQGVVSSPWVCLALAVVLSFVISLIGSAYWKRRRGSGDLFFSEVLLWGWLRRLRIERQLSKAVEVLHLEGGDTSAIEGHENLDQRAQLIRQLAAALDAQDPYTDGHSRRVARHAAMVARKMGLPGDEVARIQAAAAVHDVGKLRVPPEVLNKPDKLTPDEFEIAKRHAEQGAQIVACLEDAELTAIVRHHHERFDGTGYPSGLVGEDIPLGARIVAVADTFDAMTSVRPYRLATPHKEAMQALEQVSGTQLDPAVVRAFLRCYSSNRAVLVWTLLAVSPQRAFALVRGKGSGAGNASLGSIVSSSAVAAAVGLAALTAPFGAGASPAYRLSAARAPVAQTAPAPAVHKSHRHPAAKAVLAARRVRRPAHVASRSAGTSHTSRPHRSRHASVSGTSRTRAHKPASAPRSGASPKPKPKSGGGKSGGKPTGKPGKPGGGGGKPGGGKPGGGAGTGGSGGSGTVAAAPPTTVPAGGGASNGPPLTKDDCKNGGWQGFFSNQGQ